MNVTEWLNSAFTFEVCFDSGLENNRLSLFLFWVWLFNVQFGPPVVYVTPLPDPLIDYHRKNHGGQQTPNSNAFFEDPSATDLVLAKIKYMVQVIMELFPDESFNQTSLNTYCLEIIDFEEKLRV